VINTENKNTIGIVGYKQATITQEFKWCISQEFNGRIEVIDPNSLSLNNETAYIVSITRDKDERSNVINLLKDSSLVTFVHQTAILHQSAKINRGCFVAPFSSIYFDAQIGEHNILAPYCMISHKTITGTGTIFHPNTMIAGSCNIGSYCLFGIRSTVIDKVNICDSVFVGAGSMVTKNITVPGKYIGYPARKTLH